MSHQTDLILQNLVSRHPYIEYVSLVSEEAELLSRPAGHWLAQTDGDIDIHHTGLNVRTSVLRII